MLQRLAVAALAILLVGCGSTTPTSSGAANGPAGPSGPASDGSGLPTVPATPVPTPGHELYGYVPYWEMDDTIVDHLATTTLTTLALFSVTNKRDGTIDTTQNGYRRITGDVGRRMISEAHGRGVRVELVFTSFGSARNKQLFGGTVESQDKVISSLIALAHEIDADGINVDVESMDLEFVASYGAFIGRLRAALRGDTGKGQVSVATTAHVTGAAMAAAASQAGADRIFLMGYDYHWAGSAPGASAPLDRRDGQPEDLGWSLDLYAGAGVPVQRTILGLPLYGMVWPVTGPELGAPDTGRGDTWIPSDHLVDLCRRVADRDAGPDRAGRHVRHPQHRPGRCGLGGRLRRFARDAHPQARPRGRARAGRRGPVGRGLRTWSARLRGPLQGLRGGQVAVGPPEYPPAHSRPIRAGSREAP